MPRMLSPAGEMEVRIHSVDLKKNTIVLRGKFGTWESRIYLNPKDVWGIVKTMPILKFFLYALRFLFLSKSKDDYTLDEHGPVQGQ